MDGGSGVVMSPDGARWRVRRRWLDRSPPKLRQPLQEGRGEAGAIVLLEGLGSNLDFGSALDAADNPAAAIAAVAVLALIVFVALPLLGVALEIVAVVFLFGAGLLARVFFGRPWIVEAVPEGDVEGRAVFAVKGWRRSGDALRQLRIAIAAGQPPESIAGARRLATRPGSTVSRARRRGS